MVTFHSKDEIIHFVETCCKYDDAIDIKVDKRSTDAKSVMGMLLLKLNEPLEIEYGCFDDTDSYGEFRIEILQKYDVQAVAFNKRG